MKKKITCSILIFLILISIISLSIHFKKIKDKEKKLQNIERYKEIKANIDDELERYMGLVSPNCQKGSGGQLITHKTLVINGGMSKEILLDVDNKSYCGVYVDTFCPEDGINNWNIYISCNDYEDKGYVNWDEKFAKKE